MGLLDDLNDVNKIRNSVESRCATCKALKSVTPVEAEKLAERIDDMTITRSNLSKVLAENGHQVSVGSLYRHQRGECSGTAK